MSSVFTRKGRRFDPWIAHQEVISNMGGFISDLCEDALGSIHDLVYD